MHKLHSPGQPAHRIVAVVVFVFILAVTANAYTVVMRSGRRIEIPSRFIVTATTLTYETAPGMQVTLQMTAIDIAATDRANNEQPGSLMRRGLLPESSNATENSGQDEPIAQATRTITNRDLESSMRRRKESELAYETRRKQLGLPSVAESRKQAAAQAEAIDFELAERRTAQQEKESYWRGRASDLRTEMAALDAEIAWIGARLDEDPFSSQNGWGNGPFTSITSVIPFGSYDPFGRGWFGNYGAGGFHRSGWQRPNVFVAPGQSTRNTGRAPFGGWRSRGNYRGYPFGDPRGFGSRFPVYPGIGIFGSNAPDYDYSYERSALITRFNELSGERAGLQARWRQLEEEARRAGVPPGWLRP